MSKAKKGASKTDFKDGGAVAKSEGKSSSSLEKSDDIEEHETSDFTFEELEVGSITEADLVEIMRDICMYQYSPVTHGAKDSHYGRCYDLFRKDYNIVRVPNTVGELSYNYPAHLLIPAGRQGSGWYANSETETEFLQSYIELVREAHTVRSRSRFAVPVIFVDNKFICRSATVGNVTTAMYETIAKQPELKDYIVEETTGQYVWRIFSESAVVLLQRSKAVSEIAMSSATMRHLLEKDVELLDFLKIERICDLMVETEKRVLSSLLTVSSSEKMNLDVYNKFKIEQMPFPGCEFFKKYYEANRNPRKLVFNWATAHDVNVEFKLSEDAKGTFPNIEWEKFKEWDLIELTKAYMNVLLTYIARDSGSLLVHCISGWDRTPMFTCLLRVSLWADGLIHESLNTLEMAYLTLAYDWYLFGHAFPVRYSKHEEMMHFCFNFMQHMASDDGLSVIRIFNKLPTEKKGNRRFPGFKRNQRRRKVKEIASCLLRMYDQEIINAPPEKEPESMVQYAVNTIWNMIFPKKNSETQTKPDV